MRKIIWLIPLLLIAATALGSDDYVCIDYDEFQGCITDTTSPVYRALQVNGAFTGTGVSLQYVISVDSYSDGTISVPLISGPKIGIKEVKVSMNFPFSFVS